VPALSSFAVPFLSTGGGTIPSLPIFVPQNRLSSSWVMPVLAARYPFSMISMT
jgi:hypothetical protein